MVLVPLISQDELQEYDHLLERHPRTAEPPHYVVYTNSPQPFKRAMESIRSHATRTIVIDNRALFDEAPSPQELIAYPIRVYKPDCALYIAQVLTLLMTMTREMGHPYFTWMPDDADVPAGAFEELLAYVEAK